MISKELMQRMEAKLQESQKAGERESDRIEKYYDQKFLKDLFSRPQKSWTWDECDRLYNLQKAQDEENGTDVLSQIFAEYKKVTARGFATEQHCNIEEVVNEVKKDDGDHQESSQDIYSKCISVIADIKNLAPDIETYQKITTVEKLLNIFKRNLDESLENEKNPISEENEIEKPVSVSKSWETITKSGDIISGWASSEIRDKQNQIIKMPTLQNALKTYLEHGTIILQHSNRPIAKIIDYSFTNNDMGIPALWIKAKLFKDASNVDLSLYKGFSIGGYGNINPEGEIVQLRLDEISIVRAPANEYAIIDEPHKSF